MIFDSICNYTRYTALHPLFERAFRFLLESRLDAIAPGRYDIQDNDVYASTSMYATKPLAEGKWEAHERYIDIHYMAHGEELIGHSNGDRMTIAETYDPKRDVTFLAGTGDYLKLGKAEFAVFFPSDAHMPGIAIDDAPMEVTKVVVKIRC